MPALSPNSLIAITGITGYVGSHIGLAALQAGHRVRGTARSLGSSEMVKAGYKKQGITDVDSRLELVVLDDLYSVDQYRKAIQGADGVIHPALDTSKFADPSFIDSPTNSVLALLRAAKETSSIKRVIITSTSAAVITPATKNDKTLSGDDWNEESIRIVEKDKNASIHEKYPAAKTKADLAARKFMQDEQPPFDLATVFPYLNTGPVLFGEPKSTSGWVASLLKGEMGTIAIMPPQWYIDVRDDAKLHILALTTQSMGGKRIWGGAAPLGYNQMIAILRKNFPNAKVVDDLQGPNGEIDSQKFDNTLATELLGGWISLEQSLIDAGKSLGY